MSIAGFAASLGTAVLPTCSTLPASYGARIALSTDCSSKNMLGHCGLYSATSICASSPEGSISSVVYVQPITRDEAGQRQDAKPEPSRAGTIKMNRVPSARAS